jgi:hypothetical protein
LTAVERVLNKKSLGGMVRQKYAVKAKEEPVVPKAEELPIAIEHGKILCNFEFGCYLLRFAQKALSMAVTSHKILDSQNLPYEAIDSSKSKGRGEIASSRGEEEVGDKQAETNGSFWWTYY